MGFFFKFISWSRRIVLKRFQNDRDSLKCGKSNDKQCWPYKFEDILLSGRCMTPGGPGTQHAKNRIYFFFKIHFRHEKKVKNFFSALNVIDQLSNALLYIASGSLKRKRHHIKVINPPLALILESPSSYYSSWS